MQVGLPFTNSGKEPAYDIRYKADDFQLVTLPPSGDIFDVQLRDNTQCQTLDAHAGGTVLSPNFLSFKTTQTARGEHPVTADAGFVAGSEILIVQGCVRYRTLGKVHHTRFCDTVQMQAASGSPVKPTATAVPTQVAQQFTAGACPTGNGVD